MTGRRSWAACGFVCDGGKSWKGLRGGPVGQSSGGQTRAGKTARSWSTARLRALLSGQRLLAGGARGQLLRAVKIARRGGAADRAVVAVDSRQTPHALVVGVEEATRPTLRRPTGSSAADCLAGVRSEPPPTLLTRFLPTLRARRRCPRRWSLRVSRTVSVCSSPNRPAGGTSGGGGSGRRRGAFPSGSPTTTTIHSFFLRLLPVP